MTSIQFYLRCVLWLFLLYGLGSSGVTVVKGRLRRQLAKGQLTSGNAGVRLWKRMFLVLTGEQAIRGMSKLAFLVLGLVTGFGLGVGFRDHQLVTSQVIYHDVYVKEQLSTARWRMIPQFMDKIDADLCLGPPVDWKVGETLKDWTFEQQKGCKRVISYHRYPKGDLLNAAIQMR
jgi:hypothetical protein